MNKQCELSIVIATRNRATLLRRLLDRITEQKNSPQFEVIIANNGSTDNTSKVIHNFKRLLDIKEVPVSQPGKSRAINAALELVTSELIVFTDDDVLPSTDWLERIYAASCMYPECDIFGGRIDVDLTIIPSWIQKSYNLMGVLTSAHNLGDSDTFYAYGKYPYGPNMAIRRRLLHSLKSPYPVQLGPGTDFPVGDEAAFFLQFSPPNAKDRIYVATAKVFHEAEQQQLSFLGALQRCLISGQGSGKLQLPGMKETPNNYNSTYKLIIMRLATCKSLRELVCIIVRYIGFYQSSFRIRNSKT